MSSKRIVNGPSEEFALYPIKYVFASDILEEMSANTWFPTVIPMGEDVPKYRNELTDGERHTFDHTLAYLSTADVVAMRNISIAIQEKFTSPECEMVAATIGQQEANHSLSYAHIMESIGMSTTKQTELWNKYRTEPAIGNKIKKSLKYLNGLLNLPPQMNREQLIEFIHGYWYFSQIFEGVLFMSAFNLILTLNQRGLMRRTATQLLYIRRDELVHQTFGALSIKTIMAENNIKLDPVIIKDMILETYDLEKDFVNFVAPKGCIGYSKEDHLGNFRHLTNLRLRNFGLDPVFEPTAGLSWINEMAGEILGNFFETRVIEYSVVNNVRDTFDE